MNWPDVLLLIVIVAAYMHLLRETQKRSVTGVVKLNIQSREMDEDGGLPKEVASFTKTCLFIVTPVPGMELVPSGIDSAVIKRVLVDEGLLEVWCVHTISPFGPDFNATCDALRTDGWYEDTD